MANPEQAEVNMSNDSSEKKHDTIPSPPPIIERGHARAAVLLAVANVAKAMGELEAVAHAIARTLDEDIVVGG
jgi:hypothetical protein